MSSKSTSEGYLLGVHPGKRLPTPGGRCHPLYVRSVAILVIGIAVTGCKVNAEAKFGANGEGNEQDTFEEPLDNPEDVASYTDGDFALLGARHDVTLNLEGGAAKCTCLSFVTSQTNAAAFQWHGGAPRLDGESQMLIGVTSQGQSCEKEPEDSLGASYWGYETRGNDVIIVVENAQFGRPLTQVAIIPKPLVDGRIYVRPRSKSVPYGRPLTETKEYCQVAGSEVAQQLPPE